MPALKRSTIKHSIVKILKVFKRNDRRLGVAQGKRRYDLPLNKDIGTGFLALLIALMSFLAVMALAGSFALSSMTQRWSSGLENKITIEIPAEKSDGTLRNQEDITFLIERLEIKLKKNENIKTLKPLTEADTLALIEPWLGSGMALSDIPLPGLISVELHKSNPDSLKNIKVMLQSVNKDIKLDTHESWLGDLLRLTGALRFAAAFITLIIGVTTLIAVAGAIRSRIAVHRADVELLHLMGANDNYITRQFQRHAIIIALQGSIVGTAMGALTLLLIGANAGETGTALLPNFSLSLVHILSILSLPLLACIISAIAARFTVLRVLALMP